MDSGDNRPRVSFLRQLDVFNPVDFKHSCHVIGAGAIGSRVTDNLVRLGLPYIEIYDDDEVQPHNVPTGLFEPNHVGMAKVGAIKQKLTGFTDSLIVARREQVGSEHRLPGVVFVCVDSMAVRRQIWQHCIKQRPEVRLMIETRIGPQEGRIYTVQPLNLEQINWWERASSYGDEYNAYLPCTNRMAVTTAAVMAGLAVQQLINWHRQRDFAHSLSIGLEAQPLVQADRWTP